MRLFFFLKKHTAPFIILREAIAENAAAALERFRDPTRLEESLRRVCRKKYTESKAKIGGQVVRAIIYIFLTKMLLAVLLEFPADKYIYKELNWLPLLINVFLPPFLMFLVAMTIHVPGEENTRVIISKIRAIVFHEPYLQEGDRSLTFSWYPPKRSRFLINAFRILYLLAFVLTFGLIINILNRLDFTIVSSVIFIAFLSLVMLFGLAIRNAATELATIGRRESPLAPFGDFLLLPILKVGHWLSTEWAKINFFTFILDSVIEAPIKSFIEVAEEWIVFVREKKEEMG